MATAEVALSDRFSLAESPERQIQYCSGTAFVLRVRSHAERSWTHNEEVDVSIADRLKELGIKLPGTQRPIANYVEGIQVGDLVFMSGVGPRKADNSSVIGKLGADLDIDAGYDAARLIGVNMLANVQGMVGDLDRVRRIVKVLGMVNSTIDFTEHPKVIDGFSDLMVQVFGEEIGRGARSAVGMGSLPLGIAVEVEMVLQVA